MFILNNKTSNTIGPYNGSTIAANSSLTVTTSASPYIADGILLADILSGKATVTFAGNEVTMASAAAVLMQLGQLSTTDSDGATFGRVKQAPAGWTFQLRGLEFKTSTASSLVNDDAYNSPLSDATLTFYDANGTALTDPIAISTSAVKTVVDFEPTFDYYIIGGAAKALVQPTNNVRLSVIAVPDIPYNSGGSRVMAQNINFKFIPTDGQGIQADGRASKQLSYNATYHTNKLRFVVYHSAGDVTEIDIKLELYKQ